MFQLGPFSIPFEALLSGIWFGLSILFFALGHRLWKHTPESSLLLGLGGLTLILFIYSSGLLVTPSAGGQVTPAAAIQTTDVNLFVGIIAVVITLFTGVALKIAFDLRDEVSNALEDAERKWQEEGKKHAAARVELQRDTLRLRQQLEMVAKANELAASWRRRGNVEHGWESMVYRHLIRLFTDPRKVFSHRDLSLDLLQERPEMRAFLTDENWDYIRWLTTSFTSDLSGIQSQVRSLAEGLYVSHRQETSAKLS